MVADRKVWPSARTGAKGRHHRKTGPGPATAGIQRQGAKPPRRNRTFLLRNQETKNHRKDFMVSGLRYGIVLGRAFAPWRLCVKSFLPDGRSQGPGQKANSHARPGWGRMRTEFNAKAQSRQTRPDFFYYEARKLGIIEKISWFPGFLMELFWVAPLRLGVFALKVFCMLAGCKVWPAAKTGRPQGPGQKANGQRMAGPGSDWPTLPELGRAQPRLYCTMIQDQFSATYFLRILRQSAKS